MFDGMIQIGLDDGIQIGILYFAIYALIRYIRGTRSAQVLLGFGVLIVILLAFTHLFRFDVLSRVVYFLLGYVAISIVVVFQHEIRRALAMVGGQRLDVWTSRDRKARDADELAQCILKLAQTKTGALVAVERGISLAGYDDTGIPLDALISYELMLSIFTPPLPLHDGGIVVRNGRLAAAHCLFPVSSQLSLKDYGMRHRAAVGLSEETDAVVFVVSEETGLISIAYNGKLHRHDETDAMQRILLKWLRVAMPHDQDHHATFTGWSLSLIRKQWERFLSQIEDRGAHAGD